MVVVLSFNSMVWFKLFIQVEMNSFDRFISAVSRYVCYEWMFLDDYSCSCLISTLSNSIIRELYDVQILSRRFCDSGFHLHPHGCRFLIVSWL